MRVVFSSKERPSADGSRCLLNSFMLVETNFKRFPAKEPSFLCLGGGTITFGALCLPVVPGPEEVASDRGDFLTLYVIRYAGYARRFSSMTMIDFSSSFTRE